MAFAIKTDIMRELLKDEVWEKRLVSCKTMKEVENLLTQFCKEKGLKVKVLRG